MCNGRGRRADRAGQIARSERILACAGLHVLTSCCAPAISRGSMALDISQVYHCYLREQDHTLFDTSKFDLMAIFRLPPIRGLATVPHNLRQWQTCFPSGGSEYARITDLDRNSVIYRHTRLRRRRTVLPAGVRISRGRFSVPYRIPVRQANAPAPGRTGSTICPLLHSYSMSKRIPMRSVTRSVRRSVWLILRTFAVDRDRLCATPRLTSESRTRNLT
jgi:hypothetical protein